MVVTYAKLSEIIGTAAASVTAIFKQYNPTLWSSHWHNGVDIGCEANTPIKAAADGTVVDASPMTARSDGFGNRVIVEHADGVFALYAHMVKPSTLKVGDKVIKGQTIGYVGGTGKTQYSYAPHLHFTMLKGFNKSKYNIFYSNNELLDPIKICGLGVLKFSGSCSNIILESLGNLNEYYAGYPAGNTPDVSVSKADTPEVKKTVDELAKEVIRGEWGAGQERYDRLTDAGYDYDKVQKRVNEMLGVG